MCHVVTATWRWAGLGVPWSMRRALVRQSVMWHYHITVSFVGVLVVHWCWCGAVMVAVGDVVVDDDGGGKPTFVVC
jgi:hypothetical protein